MMDALSTAGLVAVVAASLAGFLLGLIPGLHVNTVLPFALGLAVAWPGAGLAVAAGTFAHLVAAVIPATFVGVPDPDSAASLLPAHRMLMRGDGRDAALVAATAALGGCLAATALLWPFKWFVSEPIRGQEWLTAAAPWLLAGLAVRLVWLERRRGWLMAAWGLGLQLASGVLALVATTLPLQAVPPLAADAALPLFGGLFGAAGLLASLSNRMPVPPQLPPPRRDRATAHRLRLATAGGVLAGLWTSAVPGMSAGLAAATVPMGRRKAETNATDDANVEPAGRPGAADAPGATRPADGRPPRGKPDPRVPLALIASVGAAHAVFTLAILWTTGRARTGVTLALRTLDAPVAWTAGKPPQGLASVLAAALLGATIAYALVVGGARHAARWSQRLPPGAMAWGALTLVVLLCAAAAGPWGLGLLAASTLLGLVPHAVGCRRLHLAGAIIVPVLWRAWL